MVRVAGGAGPVGPAGRGEWDGGGDGGGDGEDGGSVDSLNVSVATGIILHGMITAARKAHK